MRQDEVMGDWPYDPRSEAFYQAQEAANRRLHEEVLDAWRVVLDHLPAEFDKQLQDAVRFLEAQAIGS